jgi:probable rRNA maturation factor
MIEVEVLDLQAPAHRVPAEAEVRRLCTLAAASAGVHHGHLAVEFVDAERIAALNARHRNQPSATDVLSFPIDGVVPDSAVSPNANALIADTQSQLHASAGDPVHLGARELGDVVICPEHTIDVREAIVHGVLHLVGMDHETDNGEMLALQDRLLAGEDE